MARLPTGKMQEDTQELLDEYNELYNWEYNEMCRFIENFQKQSLETIMKHITDFVKIIAQS